MTNNAAIEFELDASVQDWTTFTSNKVKVAGFEWHVTGEYNGRVYYLNTHYPYGYFSEDREYVERLQRSRTFQIRNTIIHCEPVSGKDTSIWSCEANGVIAAFGKTSKGENELSCSKRWSHCFNFRNTENAAMEINFSKDLSQSDVNFAYEARNPTDQRHLIPKITFPMGVYIDCIPRVVTFPPRQPYQQIYRLELRVNITKHAQVDYSRSDNEKISSPEHAVQVVVEGKTLWLSKELLGAKSSFFATLFNDDSKKNQNGAYELKDTKMDEFVTYICIVYGVHIDVDKTSVEYLLRLEKMYPCELVRSQCCAFLLATNTLTPMEKLEIGERYRFPDVVHTAVQNMDRQTLKTIVNNMQFESYSHETVVRMMSSLSVNPIIGSNISRNHPSIFARI